MALLSQSTSSNGRPQPPRPSDVIAPNVLQAPLSDLWETLSAQETAHTFRRALTLLWQLIVKLISLLSVLLLFVAIIVVWLWSIAFPGLFHSRQQREC